ncbi:MAG TPA: GNAT family N-acetyltransferase, partial [bacterium]|nr:GNAT family N-acetyltransferase [bacterium]
MLIRPAIPLDARAIAEIHVASWRETYVGIIPAEILDRLSVDHRERSWAKFLAEINHESNFIFVAEADGSMVGFVSGGAHRLEESTKGGVSKEQVGAFNGELTAIYLLRSHQKMGIGRSL